MIEKRTRRLRQFNTIPGYDVSVFQMFYIIVTVSELLLTKWKVLCSQGCAIPTTANSSLLRQSLRGSDRRCRWHRISFLWINEQLRVDRAWERKVRILDSFGHGARLNARYAPRDHNVRVANDAVLAGISKIELHSSRA